MTINYTTLLQLPQPVDGTEAGTWGDVLNNAQAAYLDIAIAGGLPITITTTDVTLAYTQGTSSATNIGSTTSQYAILNVSGAMTGARNLIVPSTSKWYIINNACTGGYTLTIKGASTTGVGLANSEKALVAWNGSDFVKISSTVITNLTGTLPVTNGGTGLTTTPANGALDIGNGTGFTRTTLTAGSNITITNGAGSISIAANAGTVTSVAATVPSFLSVIGSPITTSGTLAIAYSGTALPVANGGTGVTTSTGTDNVVLSTGPTITSPTINGTPVMGASVITSGTAVASTSGTSIDFTGIPSWVKRITVMFNGVSTNGTSVVLIQIGSGSFTTSGYLSTGWGSSASSLGNAGFTNGFPTTDADEATYVRYGSAVIANFGSNAWVFNSTLRRASGVIGCGAGGVTLGGTLDRVRVTTVNGTDTFDAGSINILYE